MEINIPLLITYVLSLIVMLGLPIVLAFLIVRRFKVSWLVVLTGVLTFIASQVLRVPASYGINTLFNNGILPIPSDYWAPLVSAVIAGLMAGIFEETARWVGFKVLKRKAEKFGSALALGVGHGGAESILLAVLGTATTLFTVLFFNAGAQIAKGISTGEVQYTLFQIEQFWMNPWHTGLLPGVERLIAIVVQIFLSTLVWRAVVERSFLWFLMAVLFHTIVDGVAVFLSSIGWSYWPIEGILSIFMLISLYLIYRFWRDEKELEEEIGEFEVKDDDEDDEEEDDDEDDDYEDDELEALDELEDEVEEIEGDVSETSGDDEDQSDPSSQS